jgi:RNA polymerase sigma factor (sigma-70 family)
VGGARLSQLEAVYRRESRRLARVCLAILDDEELARDAVQEGFANAVRARGSFRSDGPLEGWVWRIVLNAALRLQAARPVAAPEPERLDGDAQGIPSPPDDSVRAAVAALPERQRVALFLRFYADLDYKAIAAVLGVQVGTVSATLHSAQAALRRAPEEVEHERA